MDSEQKWREQQAPEVVNQNYPEVVPVQHDPYSNTHNYPHQQQYPQAHQNYILPKPEDGTSTYASGNTPYSVHSASHHTDHTSPRALYATPATAPPSSSGEKARSDDKNNKGGGLVCCGLNTLVLVLSAIIAALFVAMVGLAAGTGVQANRANVAEAKVRAMSSAMSSTMAAKTVTATATAASATSTSFAALDDGCSSDAAGVSGTTYSAFALIGGHRAFTVQCNADAVGSPLLRLFTSDINTCMDACAAFSQDTPAHFGDNSNTTCGGVSFVPAWTNKTVALAGTAPGNCYLKPIQTAAPNTPNIGTECHAGILVT